WNPQRSTHQVTRYLHMRGSRLCILSPFLPRIFDSKPGRRRNAQRLTVQTELDDESLHVIVQNTSRRMTRLRE
ncbi:hypothetical protein, partial [Paraburkholderia tropica]|uniref:hypothetical protein n=1 Tax=Paraburkholderia tropica TaxID=92647 RepID=UPI001ABCFD4A